MFVFIGGIYLNIFLNIIISVVFTVFIFFIGLVIFNGDLTPYFINVVFCGVIIGLLITIDRKLIEIQKSKVHDISKHPEAFRELLGVLI